MTDRHDELMHQGGRVSAVDPADYLPLTYDKGEQDQSAVEGPIQPRTIHPVVVGDAPAAMWDGAEHRDAKLVRIADESTEGGESADGTRYFEHSQSSPECLKDQGAGAFVPSNQLRD